MGQVLLGTALDAPIRDFLAHKRTLGRGYENEERVLRGVRGFLVLTGTGDLDQTAFNRWCQHLALLSANTRRSRQRIVHKFCLYRRRTDTSCFVPDPLYFARPQPYRAPVLVEPEQVARMLACAAALPPSANSPLRAEVLRLAIVLLYTAGLRRGEVLRLTLADVDGEAGVVRVRESKFHKSRLVPLSASAHGELRRYLRRASQSAATFDRPHRFSATTRGVGVLTPERVCATASRTASALRQPRNQWSRHEALIPALAHLGRLDESQRTLDELLRLRPNFTLAFVRKHNLISQPPFQSIANTRVS